MTEQPQAPRVHFDALPSVLTLALRWVLWRHTWIASREEWAKVPYRASGGRASSTDPSAWAALAAVREAYESSLDTSAPFSGVGIVVTDEDGILGVDLDGCLGPDGLAPWAVAVLAMLPPTYTEVSPSGTGLRLFLFGKRPEGAGNRVSLEGHVPSVPGPKRPELEWYTSDRYLTLTGLRYGDTPDEIAEADPRALRCVWDYVKGLASTPDEEPVAAPPARPAPSLDLSDAELPERARSASNGAAFSALYDRGDTSAYGGDESRATAALLFHLAFWTGGDALRMDALFRSSALMRPKWDARRGDSTWGALEIERAIGQTSEHYSGSRSERRTAERNGAAYAHRTEEPAERAVLRWHGFPVDELGAIPAALACASAASIGCDVAFVAAPILAILGGAVGNSYRVLIKTGWEETSAVWVGIVAESGGGKSPGLDAAAFPVYQLESEVRRAYEVEHEEYEARLELWNAKSKADKASTPKPEKPERNRYRTSDPTLESLALLLAQIRRGLIVIRDELGGWIGGLNQYKTGGADVQAAIEMWGARPLVIDRKTGDHPVIYVESPNASVVGGIQPSVLRDRITPEMAASGFLARNLLVSPPERALRFTDAEVSEGVREAYSRLVRGMYARPLDDEGKPRILPLSRAARAVFAAFVNENADMYERLSGPLRSALVRLPSYAARFALLLHLADTPPEAEPGPISDGAMVRAVRLVRWFRYEAARIYAANGFTEAAPGDRDARLARQLPETFKWEDVRGLWEVEKSSAYETIKRLIRRGLAEDAGRGVYHRLASDTESDFGEWTPDLPDLPDYPDGEDAHAAVSPVSPANPASGDGIPAPGDVTLSPAPDEREPWEGEAPF